MTSSALFSTEWDCYAFGLQVLDINKTQKLTLGRPGYRSYAFHPHVRRAQGGRALALEGCQGAEQAVHDT